MKKKKKGFSLTELVLVITIVVILSVISGPIYNSYSTKAKQAEGYALLGTILAAERIYYDEYGYFLTRLTDGANSTCNFVELGIDARSNNYYTNFTTWWWLYGEDPNILFTAEVYAAGYPSLKMRYNITSGATYY